MTKAEKSVYDKEYRARPEVRKRERERWATQEHKAMRHKYTTSEKGRQTLRVYAQTPKSKANKKKCNASPQTRAAIEAWRKTPRGIASQQASALRHAEQRKVHAKKPESKLLHWRWSLKFRYNLTEADYNAMLESQGGVCAICENQPKKKRLHVDHDHVTGKVRGLLCARCNLTLGFWNDDPKRFARAAAYLLQTHGQPSLN